MTNRNRRSHAYAIGHSVSGPPAQLWVLSCRLLSFCHTRKRGFPCRGINKPGREPLGTVRLPYASRTSKAERQRDRARRSPWAWRSRGPPALVSKLSLLSRAKTRRASYRAYLLVTLIVPTVREG